MSFLRSIPRCFVLHQGDNDVPPDRWQNRDLVPLPPSRRLWEDFDFVGLWSTVFLTIYAWQASSSLLSYGLNVWQSVICTVIARILIYAVILSLGWIGGVWHISYTVQSRYTFGIWGSLLPIFLRVGVTCVWYGVQGITGGLLVSCILSCIFPSYQNMRNTLPASTDMTTKEFVGFVVYNIIALPILYLPPDKLRKPLRFALVISTITIFGLAIGLMAAAHGAGSYVSTPATAPAGGPLGWAFVHGITTLLGGNAVGMTSQTDFSRFARRPRNMIWGQAIGVLFFGLVVPVFGVLGTSAAGQLYGDVTALGLWNPPSIPQIWLNEHYHEPKMRAAAFFVSLGLLLNILALNSVENGVSGGMDFAGLWPKYINIRRGSYLIAAVAVAMNPWYILADAANFTSALNSFGIVLGPIMGVYTADYYAVRKQKVKLGDLYHDNPSGIYYFVYGVNPRAFVAWIVGFAPAIGGMASVNPNNNVPAGLIKVFYLGFPLGYALSFFVHWGLNVVFPPAGLGQIDSYDSYGTFSTEEALALGIEPNDGNRNEEDPEWISKEANVTETVL